MWTSRRTLCSLFLLFGIAECSIPGWYTARNHITHQHYAIQINKAITPMEVSELLGLEHLGQLGKLNNYHVFVAPKQDIFIHEQIELLINGSTPSSLRKRGNIALNHINHVHKETLRKRVRRNPTFHRGKRDAIFVNQGANILNFKDPGFQSQWHLNNQENLGNDLNILKVWQSGVVGENVVVALLDDGLDMNSDDLRHNYFAEGSYDFNDHSSTPNPKQLDDYHGTRCAGEIAAANNSVCGVGVAFGSKVSGIRILSEPISDVDEALALVYENQKNHIYSCSWGPPDNGRSMEAPSKVILDALISGITKGREGKGSIFVFATGNGGEYDDNCNFDGYANSIYTVSIGAIDRFDQRPAYSEQCAAQLAVTYSSSTEGDGIVNIYQYGLPRKKLTFSQNQYTTDVGKDACTNAHGGTSAAAPLAAGVFALVLSIRPDLHWRDIQHLAVRTAQPFALNDSGWEATMSGRKFNHKYGYGKLDAYQMVEAARKYNSVGPQVQVTSEILEVDQQIPSTRTGLKHHFVVSSEMAQNHFLNLLEHVTVTVNIEHQRRGDIEVYLVSPNNVTSILSSGRQFDESDEGFKNWTFMSVKHWDEPIVGTWTLLVLDSHNSDKTGTLLSWSVNFFGAKYDTVLERSGDGQSTKGSTPSLASEDQQFTSLRYPIIAIFGTVALFAVAATYRFSRTNHKSAKEYRILQDAEPRMKMPSNVNQIASKPELVSSPALLDMLEPIETMDVQWPKDDQTKL